MLKYFLSENLKKYILKSYEKTQSMLNLMVVVSFSEIKNGRHLFVISREKIWNCFIL